MNERPEFEPNTPLSLKEAAEVLLRGVVGVATLRAAAARGELATERFEARALRPCDVARMWRCSERHVRGLIAKGDLRHFRVGGKLVRIPIEAVTEYEQRREFTSRSSRSER